VELYTIDRIRGERADLVARESVVGTTVVLLVFGGLGLGWVLAPMPSVLLRLGLGIFGLPCLLIFALMLPGVARTWRRGQWVLRARREGLALNVRSALNSDLPTDEPTVAWIPAEEIEGVRRVDELREVPGSEGRSEQRRCSWLELVLAHGDTGELAAVLVRERALRGRGRTQFHAYPVEVAGPRAVRVAWHSGGVSLRPRLDGFLKGLGRFVHVIDSLETPSIDWRTLPDEELDDYARALVASGQRMDAIRVLRERRGWELVRARAWIDTLERRARAA